MSERETQEGIVEPDILQELEQRDNHRRARKHLRQEEHEQEEVLAGKVKTGEGERRQATIVFSDLSGYTSMNERLDPEEVEAIMSRIKMEAVKIVGHHEGIVNQFVGDEVLALFGIPAAHEDDPMRAVRGKTKPLIPYHVTGESAVQTRFEAAKIQGLTTFTGREQELTTLYACLDKTLAGKGQFVTVLGEAGLGKSRLTYEFRHSLNKSAITVLLL